MHAVTCTPRPKDAKKYCLQNGLCDLVLLFPGCCKFGLPVPLFCFISWCSSKPFRLPPSSSCPLLSSMPLLPTYAVYTRTSTYALPTLNTIVRAEAWRQRVGSQLVQPSRGQHSQPVTSRLMMRQRHLAKWRAQSQCRSPRTQRHCTNIQGT